MWKLHGQSHPHGELGALLGYGPQLASSDPVRATCNFPEFAQDLRSGLTRWLSGPDLGLRAALGMPKPKILHRHKKAQAHRDTHTETHPVTFKGTRKGKQTHYYTHTTTNTHTHTHTHTDTRIHIEMNTGKTPL